VRGRHKNACAHGLIFGFFLSANSLPESIQNQPRRNEEHEERLKRLFQLVVFFVSSWSIL
jgi:uncharacterized protein YneF (UPF0154 family)